MRGKIECEGKQINGEDWVGREAQTQNNYKCALWQRQCRHMVLMHGWVGGGLQHRAQMRLILSASRQSCGP